MKLYVLCDAHTRYILKFFVYSGGKEIEYTHNEALGKSGSIVTSLLDPYLEQGHVIYVDNFYSIPALFGHLFSKATGACGTVRPNRKEMPKFTKKLKRGEIDYYHSDELLALTWHDKRDVHMLSTVHTPIIVDTNKVHHKTKEIIRKPQCVTDYINSMGAVDKSDMQISLAECVRKTRKWYKKLFFHLIDMAMYNAYILYQHNIGKKHSFYKFKLAAAKQIIQAHSSSRETSGRPQSSGESPLRLTGKLCSHILSCSTLFYYM